MSNLAAMLRLPANLKSTQWQILAGPILILLILSMMVLPLPVKRRTKNAKAFHDKCENFSFRASNETAVLITAFYSLHGDHLGYG